MKVIVEGKSSIPLRCLEATFSLIDNFLSKGAVCFSKLNDFA